MCAFHHGVTIKMHNHYDYSCIILLRWEMQCFLHTTYIGNTQYVCGSETPQTIKDYYLFIFSIIFYYSALHVL